MNTLKVARYDSLARDRKGIEVMRPMTVQMTIEAMKHREPFGAVNWVMPWALAMMLLAVMLDRKQDHAAGSCAGERRPYRR